MPTKRPRLNVVVTDEQHALLLELGALQGRSAASYLREMLDAATPMLRQALPIWRAAAAQAEVQSGALQDAIRSALEEVDEHIDQLNLLELLAGHTPLSASNDVPKGDDAVASGASEDAVVRRRASGRKPA